MIGDNLNTYKRVAHLLSVKAKKVLARERALPADLSEYRRICVAIRVIKDQIRNLEKVRQGDNSGSVQDAGCH